MLAECVTASPGVLKWRAPVDNKAWGQDVDKGLLTLYQLSFWDKTLYLSVVEAIWYEPLHGCLSLWLLTFWIDLSQSKIKSLSYNGSILPVFLSKMIFCCWLWYAVICLAKKMIIQTLTKLIKPERKANHSSCDNCSSGTGIVVDLTCVRSTQKGKGGG